MCVSEASASERGVPREEIERHTGLSLAKIDGIERAGLIRPRRTAGGREYDSVDCRIISLVRRREEAGLPFAYTLEMMSIYRRHIKRIVEEDAKLFMERMASETTPQDFIRYVREGDRTLSAFMPLIREKLARANAEGILGALEGAGGAVREALRFRLDPARVEGLSAGRHAGGRPPPLWFDFVRAAGNGRGSRPRPGTAPREGRKSLLAGLRALKSGRLETARAQLEEAVSTRDLAPLASALLGHLLVLEASSGPGLFKAMELVRRAVERLRASPRRAAGIDP